ncbi:hypothetical protein HBI49_062150 [Parastagonospora nodorum]|nr:hypothetical protein HBH49_128630 [Parastagonospora nodorum]KAH5035776.1 hypothetical protein HBI75_082150 [Parastagonospora nodorum]KAH5372436.1 hypothetical protein HBI49_062150 [Parastagonospora nodorum]KAH5468568.1 hypothetical protein HBI28_185600 [Parastagonospora nodorum]KAH5509137.1 hypothetical protein HBI52_135240 [Parastagonospora nodorum]
MRCKLFVFTLLSGAKIQTIRIWRWLHRHLKAYVVHVLVSMVGGYATPWYKKPSLHVMQNAFFAPYSAMLEERRDTQHMAGMALLIAYPKLCYEQKDRPSRWRNARD